MLFVGKYNRIAALLAIVTVFSTVAPVSVFAENSFITNVVSSYNSTGGHSTSGQKGQDGKDGLPGKDGQSGAQGTSVISTANGEASVSIQTTAGELSIQEQHVASREGTSTIEVSATTSSSLGVDTYSTSSQTVSRDGVLVVLHEALLSLRVMLMNYVSLLF